MSISLNRISLFPNGIVVRPVSAAYPKAIESGQLVLSYLALHRIRLSEHSGSHRNLVVSYTTVSPLPSTYFEVLAVMIFKVGAG